MKLLLLLVLLSGCNLLYYEVLPPPCEYVYDIEGFMQDNSINSFNSVWLWVSMNIAYTEDVHEPGKIDDWQSPYKTMHLRTGDCEDYAILLGYMLQILGIESTLIGVNWPQGGHMIIKVDDWYIEPQIFAVYYNAINVESYIVGTWSVNRAVAISIQDYWRSISGSP